MSRKSFPFIYNLDILVLIEDNKFGNVEGLIVFRSLLIGFLILI